MKAVMALLIGHVVYGGLFGGITNDPRKNWRFPSHRHHKKTQRVSTREVPDESDCRNTR